jgi:hypothetical protein
VRRSTGFASAVFAAQPLIDPSCDPTLGPRLRLAILTSFGDFLQDNIPDTDPALASFAAASSQGRLLLGPNEGGQEMMCIGIQMRLVVTSNPLRLPTFVAKRRCLVKLSVGADDDPAVIAKAMARRALASRSIDLQRNVFAAKGWWLMGVCISTRKDVWKQTTQRALRNGVDRY